MSINIKAINVGDGDAIIITLRKDKLCKVIIIDGGDRDAEATGSVLNILDSVLKETGKKAPDLMVCTHYDDDHIRGLIEVANKYGTSIGEAWVLTPSEEYGRYIKLLKEAVGQKNNQNFATKTSTTFLVESLKSEPVVEREVNFLIESYDSLQELISSLKGVKIIEPFGEKHIALEGFPNFKAIGPMRSFYEHFLKKKDVDKLFLKPELLISEIIGHRSEEAHILESAVADPCGQLGKKSIGKITAVNMVSIICLYEEQGKKYLFPGDAGIESFETIPDYKALLEGLEFAMIQHHGALYNTSAELIVLFRPKVSFVSAKGKLESGVVKRPHPYVLGCYASKGLTVYKTQDCEQYLEFTEDGKVIVH